MILGLGGLVLLAEASTASAQAGRRASRSRGTTMASQIDLYGNASANAPLRRELDVFQNSAQRAVLKLYEQRGRRQQQRGGFLPFSLPADTYRRNQRSQDTTPVLPFSTSGAAERSAFRRLQAFRGYGGFGARSSGPQVSDVQHAFARRYDLIAATSNAAPVHRANIRHASVAGMLTSIDMTPFDKRGADLTEPAKSQLVDVLAYDVARSHRRVLQEAWDSFRDGEYRKARRAFESAAVLDSDDYIAQVGMFFSMMQLGSVRAAHTVLLTLNQHDPNPFLHQVNVADVLENRERVALLRARSVVASDAPARAPNVAAMNAFVAWYLGDRDQALTVATAIVRQSPGTPFDDWPVKMRAAMGADAAPTP